MILLDNTVLSNFALIHRPEFIKNAFIEEIATTEEVFQELEKGIQIGSLPKSNFSWLQRLELTKNENAQFHQLTLYLGKGEAACLSMASHRKFKIATDDKDARRWAMQLSIPFTGTLGILAILVKQKQITISEGNSWLRQMIIKGYHSPISKLDNLINV